MQRISIKRISPSTVAKIAGGTLIIEEAGDLDDAVVEQLSKAMEFRTDALLVVLEDEKKYLKELFEKHPDFAEKFTSEIVIPVFTNDELVEFWTYLCLRGRLHDRTKKQSRRSMIESVSCRKRADRLL